MVSVECICNNFFFCLWMIQIREACLAMGLEFRAVDMRWGVKEMWFEPTQWTKLSHWELERDVKESLSVSTIVFFGKSAYGPRCLPSEIDESVFERLRKQAKRLEETGFYKSDEFSWGVTMLENWYEIDENYVPARRVLKPLSVMMPGFEDVKKKAYWWRIWEEQTFPVLQRILRISALSLAHKRILDPPSVQRLVQSFFQEEVVRGILKQSRRGSWERGVLVTNSLDVEEAMPVVLDSGADPKEVEEVVKKARNETRLLGELWNNLFAAVPYENRILEKTEIEADESDDRTQLLVEELTEKVKKLIIRSMNFRTKPNPLVEEILVHTTQFRLKSRDHIRRQHLIDKVINFMSRPDSWPLPPFLLYGEASMGRTSLLGKALQKFVQKAVDAPSPMNYYDTKSNASRAESPMPLLSSQSDKGNMNASMSTPSLASPRRRRSVHLLFDLWLSLASLISHLIRRHRLCLWRR
ncbi:hypothetical protein BC829DRAFT_180263 [Chytridium lagenaria]|nr:hypothetical protein BC829DRAFT_180263 [Chytridium lagenaria]